MHNKLLKFTPATNGAAGALPQKKTWIYYFVRILIFGPKLGLIGFIIFITRDASIPMLLVSIAGVSLGILSQLMILQANYNPKHKPLILASSVVFGFIAVAMCFVFLRPQSFLAVAGIALLFIVYASYIRFRLNTP